jgi:hypothetical protein
MRDRWALKPRLESMEGRLVLSHLSSLAAGELHRINSSLDHTVQHVRPHTNTHHPGHLKAAQPHNNSQSSTGLLSSLKSLFHF